MTATAPAQPYDQELQMFVEPAHQPSPQHVAFLRWLAERGRLEHLPIGLPSGDLLPVVAEMLFGEGVLP